MEQVRREPVENRIKIAVAGMAAIVLAAGLMFSIWMEREARNTIASQFNEEQLMVARNIRHFVERELGLVKRELLLLAENLRLHSAYGDEVPTAIQESFHRVVENGIRKIEVLDLKKGRCWVYIPFKLLSANILGPQDLEPGPTGAQPSENPVWISPPIIQGPEILLKISAPITPDRQQHVVLHLNVGWFLNPFIKEIRSGQSGYAWIIDSTGTFLFHPYSAYIGQNAFEIRAVKFSNHSFEQINRIQGESMLKGQEGTGEYTSVWHRGLTGEIRKLIAYTPIPISEHPRQYWSVAVVAPYSEIHASVSRLHLWHLALMGLVLLMVGGSAATILFFEARWSRVLEKKIFIRTEALKRSEEKYRSLVESAEDFIFTMDAEGKFLSVNSYTAAFFGSTAELLICAPVSSVFPGDTVARIQACVTLVFEKKRSLREELELKRGGRILWISINFIPLRNEHGKIVSVLSIARDITENKNLERQLISAEKLVSLGTLAAGVAHELNNPLAVMLGFCDLLLQKKNDQDPDTADLKIIEQQGLYCKEIVDNLLSFARVGEHNSTATDVNQCLERVLAIVRHCLEMQSIELEVALAGELPLVKGDSRQLQQVFLNLINNAAAAMKNGGRLKIKSSLERGRRRVLVEFQDNGRGIRPEDIDRIYDPFFTTKPEGEGTGLGLFISYGILKRYGAEIACYSQVQETPGGPGGTSFTLRLAPQ